MPERKKSSRVPSVQTERRSVFTGQKDLLVEGGRNKKGGFICLTEKIGKRINYIYVPIESADAFLELIRQSIAETKALVPTEGGEEPAEGD